MGHAVVPCASVGVGFRLLDEEDRLVDLGVDVWVRNQEFEVTGSASVDDPSQQRQVAATNGSCVTCQPFAPRISMHASRSNSVHGGTVLIRLSAG